MSNGAFAEWLRAKREEKKFSVRGFAKKVGVSPSYVSQIERGELPPPANDKIKKMAEVLSENVDRMMLLAGRVPADSGDGNALCSTP